jgi:hypothetical protein
MKRITTTVSLMLSVNQVKSLVAVLRTATAGDVPPAPHIEDVRTTLEHHLAKIREKEFPCE